MKIPVYKDEQRGTWYAMFYGTDWTGKKHKYKKRGFKLKREAQEYEREFKLKQARSCDMLFDTFVDLYYNYSENVKKNRPSTMHNKKNVIETHIRPYFKNKKVSDITANDIHEWQQELLSQEYRDTYLRTIHTKLSAILNYAVTFHGLQSNPCRQAGSMGSKKPDTIDFWTLDEFKTVIPTIVDKPRGYTAIMTLYWSGIREGELLALLPTDIIKKDKGGYALSITKTWQIVDGEELVGPPKSESGIRQVDIPKFLGKQLEKYMGMLYECPDDVRIFYGATKSFLAYEITRGSEKSGIKKIRVHDLRHSHVSLLRKLGYSFEVIAKRIGHEDIKYVIETYNHIFPDVEESIVKNLEDLEE